MVSVPRALATAAVLLGALQTTAQAKELVVAIFGGSFLDNTKACHGAPFEKRTGAKVNFVLGNSVQNVAKLRAAQGRSEVDVAYMDLQIVQQAKAEGLLQKVNAERVPNLKDLYPSAKDPDLNWVGIMYSGTTIAYNPKMIKDPPQSWGDFWNPAYKGKVALADITATFGQHFLLAAARLRGGSMDNTDPGFAALKELHPNVVTYYTQADQLVSLFRARRHRHRAVVGRSDRRGRGEGRAGRGELPEGGRRRNLADRLRPEGREQRRSRPRLHRRPLVARSSNLFCGEAIRRADEHECQAARRAR